MQKIKSLNNFEAEDIDLRKLIKTIYRGKRNFIAITSLTFILSIFYAFSLTPKWRGQFDIVLENNEKGSTGQIGNPLEILNINKLSVQQTLNTEVAILKSPSVLNPIYEFVKKEKNSSDIEKFKQPYSVWFKNNFKVELIQGTTVLKVIYEDEKKDIILPVLQRVSKEYKLYSGRNNIKNLRRGVTFLENQFNKYKKISESSLEELQDFALKNNLGTFEGFLINYKDETVTKSNIKSSTYDLQFDKLAKLEALLSEKLSLYKPNTSLIIDLENRIKFLKNSLERPKEVLLKFRQLEKKAIFDETIFINIRKELEQLKIEKAREQEPWKLISMPVINQYPVSPNKKLISLGGLILGTLLGGIFTVIIDKRKNLIYDFDYFLTKLPYPLIKRFSLKNIINPSESIELIFKGKLSSLNEHNLALLSVNKDKEDFKKEAEFLKNFKNFTKKNNLLITNVLNKTYDFTNIILILQPGVISQQELELYLEDLNLLESKVIGFIYIET